MITTYVIIGAVLGLIAYAGLRADRQARLDQPIRDAEAARAARRWRVSCVAVATHCPVRDGLRKGSNYQRFVDGKQLG